MIVTATYTLEFPDELVECAKNQDRVAWKEMVDTFVHDLQLIEENRHTIHEFDVQAITEKTCIRNYRFEINVKPIQLFEM